MLATDCSIEGPESLTDGAIGLLVDEVASGGGAHLSFCLFNEGGLGSTHQGRAGGASDGGDVASCESVGRGNDGRVHRVSVLSLDRTTAL